MTLGRFRIDALACNAHACDGFDNAVPNRSAGVRTSEPLDAEILFLRRQLGLYGERVVKPRRFDAATPVALTFLSRRLALCVGDRPAVRGEFEFIV